MANPAKVVSMNVKACEDIATGEAKLYLIESGKSDEEHPEVNISVSLQDSVHWYCNDKKFRVLKVDRYHDDNAPLPLFYRRFPEDNLEFSNQVNSGPPRPEAVNHHYKAHFEFEDESKLDPHIRVKP